MKHVAFKNQVAELVDNGMTQSVVVQKAIIEALDLLRPIYQETATYGHFGRELAGFTWEFTNRVDELRRACGF